MVANKPLCITDFWSASALGAGNAESAANLAASTAPGMKLTGGDIPGRDVYFGNVETQLPGISEPKDDFRSNQLLALAFGSMAKKIEELKAKYPPERIGVVLGASDTGVHEAQNFIFEWLEGGKKPDRFHFEMLELGSPAKYFASIAGLRGPAYSVSTACSSSAKAFASARRLIYKGVCDAVIAGGVDSRCAFALNGFAALGALSEGRCRPLSPDRDGINLGEAVALFSLEKDPEGAKARILGVGETSDAYHATAPDPSGEGAAAAMRQALDEARLSPENISYVNLHGTGTVANDEMELKAVESVFGSSPRALVESTKNLTGHCLGAAGAIEAAICIYRLQALGSGTALSNSFAFGGSNASIIISVD